MHLVIDHSSCSEEWCGFFKDRENYKHKSLPYGKDLVLEDLRLKCTHIMQRNSRPQEAPKAMKVSTRW